MTVKLELMYDWLALGFHLCNERKRRRWQLRLARSDGGAGCLLLCHQNHRSQTRRILITATEQTSILSPDIYRLINCRFWNQVNINVFRLFFHVICAHFIMIDADLRYKITPFWYWLWLGMFSFFRSLNSTQGEIRVGPSHQVQPFRN